MTNMVSKSSQKLHVYFYLQEGTFNTTVQLAFSWKNTVSFCVPSKTLYLFSLVVLPLSMFSVFYFLLSFDFAFFRFYFLSSTFCGPQRCFHIAVEPILVGHPFPTENA